MLTNEVPELVAQHRLRLRRREVVDECRRDHHERRAALDRERVRVRPRVRLDEEFWFLLETAQHRDCVLKRGIQFRELLVRDLEARREVVEAKHLLQRRRGGALHGRLE